MKTKTAYVVQYRVAHFDTWYVAEELDGLEEARSALQALSVNAPMCIPRIIKRTEEVIE